MGATTLPTGHYMEIDIERHGVYRWYGRGVWFRRSRLKPDAWINTPDALVPADVLRFAVFNSEPPTKG